MKPGSPDDAFAGDRAYAALPVLARFSPHSGLGGELDVSGSRDALLQMATAIDQPAPALLYTLLVPESSAQPYEGFLSTLRLEERDDPVQIATQGSVLCISGRRSLLAILAKEFRHVAEADTSNLHERMRYHAHVEYYPGHFFLAPGSIPLIISLDDRTQP